MVQSSLNDLKNLSDELSELLGKPPATPQDIPPHHELHPKLASVLASGALSRQGVDIGRVTEFTQNARSRGMRRKALVFGWHPNGLVWFATPERFDDEPIILVIKRLDRLATEELTLTELVDLCIKETRDAIAEATAPEPEPEPPTVDEDGEVVPTLKGGRLPIRVNLPDSDGATIVADGRTEEFTAAEFGYIVWCMTGLQMMSAGDAPDLSRWESRCLRSCRMDAIPAPKHANRATYDENWMRLTRRDRSAVGPVHHQVQGWKLVVPGSWILAPNESAVLRRADQSIPPRHIPTPEQIATWTRWMAVVKSDAVELHIH